LEVKKFGNSGHVFVYKEFFGKEFKVILGGRKIEEILSRRAKSFGTGCHVILPKEYVGKRVKLILVREGRK